jgi:hypothetical protein
MKIRSFTTAASFVLITAGAAFAGQETTVSAPIQNEVKEDLGDIHPANESSILSHVRASVQVQGQAISNAALLGNSGNGDFLTLPTLDVGYNQPLKYGFTFDLDAKLETVIYSREEDRGFWGASGAATLDWRYHPNAPRVFVAAEPYRYNSFDTGQRSFEALALSAGIDDGYFINRGRTMVYGGYKFSHFYADPSADDRDTHRLTIGLTQQIRPAIYGQIYYSYEYMDYLNEDRNDSRNVVGLNFVYQINQHLFASINGTFVDNDSSRVLARYHDVIVGTGLTLQF